MKVLKNINELQPMNSPTSVALGLFDGVHRGHKTVIDCAVALAGDLRTPLVMSFTTKHAIPSNKINFSTIITDTIKQSILKSSGVKILVEPDFVDIKEYTAEQFVHQILFKKFQAQKIVCGYDYRFGKGAVGTVELLQELGERNDVQVQVLPPLMDGGEPISSTRIRQYISQGDIQSANRLLGHAYCFDFPVTDGAKIGRTIGVPTINQMFQPEFLIPKFGVYASKVSIDHHAYYGVTNVGVKPTVHNTTFPLAETHIIGFNGDLYHKRIKVHLLEYLRGEQKFAGIQELKQAIEQNINDVTNAYL